MKTNAAWITHEKAETYRVIQEWHIVCISSLICGYKVSCPWILSLWESSWLCTHNVAFSTPSMTSHILSRQEGWSFKMMRLCLIHSSLKKRKKETPNKTKNPIDWDFRISMALCPSLCHRFFIRPLAIVTSVRGFSVSCWNVNHAVHLLDLCFSFSYGRKAYYFSWCCIHSNTVAIAKGPNSRRNFIIRASRKKFWSSSTWQLTDSVTC